MKASTLNAMALATSLTKREAMALAAMQGLLANPNNDERPHWDIAERALHAADALLTELNPEP